MAKTSNPGNPPASGERAQGERAQGVAPVPTSQPEIDRLLEALGGIQAAIGSSNDTLRGLAGPRTVAASGDSALNLYFARVQRRSLPRGSLRVQTGSIFSGSREA